MIDEDQNGLQPVTWRGAVWRWRSWYEDSRDSQAVFENLDGDRVKGSDPNRFHPDYGDKQYAKLKDLERGIKEDYGRRLHTAMLTFTASSKPSSDGEPLPPVDHLNGLLSSWGAITRELRRCMEGRRYERLAILEPHPSSGYLHIHMAVFVDGKVTAETFEPVIEAHLRNCSLAAEEAHDLDDDSTISVRWAGGERDLDGDHLDELAIYLAEYLGTYGEDPLDQDETVQMGNALLWATETKRWRPSQPDYVECSICGTMHHPRAVCHDCGSEETEPRPPDYSKGAQEYMRAERSEPSPEWELIGIEDGAGELHEASGGFGGVTKLETFTPRDRWGPLRAKDGPPAD